MRNTCRFVSLALFKHHVNNLYRSTIESYNLHYDSLNVLMTQHLASTCTTMQQYHD